MHELHTLFNEIYGENRVCETTEASVDEDKNKGFCQYWGGHTIANIELYNFIGAGSK